MVRVGVQGVKDRVRGRVLRPFSFKVLSFNRADRRRGPGKDVVFTLGFDKPIIDEIIGLSSPSSLIFSERSNIFLRRCWRKELFSSSWSWSCCALATGLGTV